jgi:SAM-dependent methyltransferase
MSRANGDVVIIQDADLEYDPTEYEALLEPLRDGRADVVFGSRFHNSRPHRVLYYWHSVGNRILTTASNMVTNLNLTDMETCYKVFRREVLESLVVDEDRFGFEPEITSKVAASNWRVFEVGISYSGRTYAEGKKIGWKDGVRAFYCIFRYGFATAKATRDNAASLPASFNKADAELQSTLENLDDATNYASWITSLMEPYLGGRILEVGAGHGTLTERLAGFGEVVASELSEDCLQVLRKRFHDREGVSVVQGDKTEGLAHKDFDHLVLVNVLEHIEDDVGAMRDMAGALKPGGHFHVFVPALDSLMSDFDSEIGHYRRYSRGELITAAYRAGLEVLEARYVNSVGAAAWWLLAKKLRRRPTNRGLVSFYDRGVVPLLSRLESKFKPPIGQSLFLVARKPTA